MWVSPFDGEKSPSKFNTLDSIERRLIEKEPSGHPVSGVEPNCIGVPLF